VPLLPNMPLLCHLTSERTLPAACAAASAAAPTSSTSGAGEEAALDPEAELAGSEHVAIFKRTRAALHMLNDMQVGCPFAGTAWCAGQQPLPNLKPTMAYLLSKIPTCLPPSLPQQHASTPSTLLPPQAAASDAAPDKKRRMSSEQQQQQQQQQGAEAQQQQQQQQPQN